MRPKHEFQDKFELSNNPLQPRKTRHWVMKKRDDFDVDLSFSDFTRPIVGKLYVSANPHGRNCDLFSTNDHLIFSRRMQTIVTEIKLGQLMQVIAVNSLDDVLLLVDNQTGWHVHHYCSWHAQKFVPLDCFE